METSRVITVHPNTFKTLNALGTYSKVRKYLKHFGFTRGEQDQIIRKWRQTNPALLDAYSRSRPTNRSLS